MTSIIELQDVSKVYPGRWFRGVPTLRDVLLHPRTKRRPVVAPNIAVDGVSLSIHAGERVGVIGPNGAGKTTLLKLVAGLSAPTSGEVTVRGRVTAILTLGVGLRDELTGRENVYIEGELQGRNREDVDRVIDTVVEFADLGEFIDLPVLTYSTGMKARLAFAAAVHVDPEILLIDEALSVGDAAFAIKARRKVRELCTRGKVAVIVSHSMENIVDLCTRCLWIEGGRLRQDGDPVTVTQMYVEAVHRRDDAALLERFRRLVGSVSSRGCEITELACARPGDGEARARLEASGEAEVRMSIRVTEPVPGADLRLRFVRLDGLVVVVSRMREETSEAEALRDGMNVLVAELRPLALGPGVYRVIAEVLDGETVVAARSTIVQIRASQAPVGGASALLYPCVVTAEPAAS